MRENKNEITVLLPVKLNISSLSQAIKKEKIYKGFFWFKQ
jgi:hypothetical protein